MLWNFTKWHSLIGFEKCSIEIHHLHPILVVALQMARIDPTEGHPPAQVFVTCDPKETIKSGQVVDGARKTVDWGGGAEIAGINQGGPGSTIPRDKGDPRSRPVSHWLTY